MKQEPLAITQTFASPEPTHQPTLQQKIEHYLKSQFKNNQKPTCNKWIND